MNAPLELGTLDGKFVTCAMHCAQFDVTTGQALSGPVPADMGNESPPPRLAAYLQHVDMLMKHVRTESIRTYETKVEAGWVHVAPDSQGIANFQCVRNILTPMKKGTGVQP